MGSWKKIPNLISSVDLKLVQPWELDTRIEELFLQWEASSKSLHNIAEFHAKFENILPFQDGNGRFGRFLMLKQCVENDIDLILIDDHYSKEYKGALYNAQIKKGLYRFFRNI